MISHTLETIASSIAWSIEVCSPRSYTLRMIDTCNSSANDTETHTNTGYFLHCTLAPPVMVTT